MSNGLRRVGIAFAVAALVGCQTRPGEPEKLIELGGDGLTLKESVGSESVESVESERTAIAVPAIATSQSGTTSQIQPFVESQIDDHANAADHEAVKTASRLAERPHEVREGERQVTKVDPGKVRPK